MKTDTFFLCFALFLSIASGCGKYPRLVDSSGSIRRLPSSTDMIVIDGLPARDWVYLAKFHALRHLNVSQNYAKKVTNQNLLYLTENDFSTLYKISLSGCNIDDIGLRYLSKIQSLRGIQLDGTRITDHGMSMLATSFPNLEGINIENCEFVTIKGILEIEESKSIDDVILSVGTLSLDDVVMAVSEVERVSRWTISDPDGKLSAADFGGIDKERSVEVFISDRKNLVRRIR